MTSRKIRIGCLALFPAHLRLQSFTLRFAQDHSFRLRLRSPMPGERGNDAGTYRNPSPSPPPAIISGRGSRSHAPEVTANSSSSSRCLLRSRLPLSVSVLQINDSGWNVATEGFCNTPSASSSPAHTAPVRITPRCCKSSVTAGEAATAPERRAR